ncbi:sensor domain-containing diguanylate cyclase [Clostridium paraputrificum]|uniref:sensor domain-containing diguanylate cyclase n=1 Tax=Clostridium paraputrificum TaxID=29363 RepID=UPI003D3456B8
MKNSFFIAIYLIILFLIVIIQRIKIKALKDKIKEVERLKKEIYRLGDRISLIDNKQDVYDFILNTAINVITKGSKGSILIQKGDGLFYHKALSGFEGGIRDTAVTKEEIGLYNYNGCKDIAILSGCNGKALNAILASPINYDGKLIGVISIESIDKNITFNDDDIGTMRYIKYELELAIKNFLIQDRLKHIATHDDLTNLYNRRSFNELLEKEICNIKKGNIEVHLALIDLDDFKKINDEYGHNAGDKALVRMANAMKLCLGKEDIYARMSGDEFVIIFRNLSYNDAEKRLLSIRENLEISDDKIKVDFTYGLVTINPYEKLQKDEILSEADRKMYEAKKNKKVGR